MPISPISNRNIVWTAPKENTKLCKMILVVSYALGMYFVTSLNNKKISPIEETSSSPCMMALFTTLFCVGFLASLYKKEKDLDIAHIKKQYFDLVENPHQYLIQTRRDGVDILTVNGWKFAECTSGMFSRLISPRRKIIEQAIVHHISESCEKNEEIYLLGLGSNDLMADWILIGKLIKEGFKKYKIAFVDPYINTAILKEFSHFFNKFNDIEIEVLHFNTLMDPHFENYFSETSFNAIYAFDFDEINQLYFSSSEVQEINPFPMKELMLSFSKLTKKGKLFFSAGNIDWLYGINGLENILFKNIDTRFIDIKKDLLRIIPKDASSINVGLYDSLWEGLMYVFLDEDVKERNLKIHCYYHAQLQKLYSHETEFLKKIFPSITFHPIKRSSKPPENLDIVFKSSLKIGPEWRWYFSDIKRQKKHQWEKTTSFYILHQDKVAIMRFNKINT